MPNVRTRNRLCNGHVGDWPGSAGIRKHPLAIVIEGSELLGDDLSRLITERNFVVSFVLYPRRWDDPTRLL